MGKIPLSSSRVPPCSPWSELPVSAVVSKRWDEDTIVALSSPAGPAHRAVVRLSGCRAIEIASRVGRVSLPPRRGAIRAPRLGPGVMAWVMPHPHSYTGEDIVEVHLLGSEPFVRLVIEGCLAEGARPAEPGEFTRRAFLNGRLDLAQAEAVQAVIAAQSANEARMAIDVLHGDFSCSVREMEEGLLALCADVEAAIDFEDQDIAIISAVEARSRTEALHAKIREVLFQTAAHRVAGARPTAFLYGYPNAGKSSLFRCLTGRETIVSDIPGTTRDLHYGDCAGVRVVDAPGMFVGNGVDGEASQRAFVEAQRADLWIVVVDGTAPLVPPDVEGRTLLWAVSKVDVSERIQVGTVLHTREAIFTSSKTGEGIDMLRQKLAEFAQRRGSESVGARFSVSVRQRDCLQEAEEALSRACEGLGTSVGMELVALDLRAALESLGQVTGRQVGEDLLKRVFERFCLGK